MFHYNWLRTDAPLDEVSRNETSLNSERELITMDIFWRNVDHNHLYGIGEVQTKNGRYRVWTFGWDRDFWRYYRSKKDLPRNLLA